MKKGMALAFDGTAAVNTRLFIALSEVLPQSPLFNHTAKPKGIDKVQTVGIGIGCCLLDIQHRQELLSQSEVILKLLNDPVTLTRGALQFPAVHDPSPHLARIL
jgi:hypothetical protein